MQLLKTKIPLQKEVERKHIGLAEYTSISGKKIKDIVLGYRIFGEFNPSSNKVLVCHALTGDSRVAGENGWWNGWVGSNKCLDTHHYPTLCFDMPGNGSLPFDFPYQDLCLKDIARILLLAIEKMGIQKFYAGIGGSLGGGLLWEMAVENPNLFEYIFPIGSHYESSDWLVGCNHVQEKILQNSESGIEIARMMAMLFYRSSLDFQNKFYGSYAESGEKNVVSYLNYQGEKLRKRFSKESYLAMNHFLSSIDVSKTYKNLDEALSRIQCKIRMVGINTDVLFPTHFNKEALEKLIIFGKDVEYLELDSVHGHDAFLIEFEKLEQLIGKYFIRQK